MCLLHTTYLYHLILFDQLIIHLEIQKHTALYFTHINSNKELNPVK